MADARFTRLAQRFLELRGASPAEREAALARLERDDPAFADELRAMIHADGDASTLDRVSEAFVPARRSLLEDAGATGSVIGPYTLVRVLGEGAYATVWLARQHQPVERDVAIKMLRGAAASGLSRERFRIERRALTLLDHPSIARVLDGGITPDGAPYLVMEHVPGVPITAYAASNTLDLQDRVELAAQLAAAVSFAHQHAVIHRDLKPSNVLAFYDGTRHVVRVIDFGIAKAIALSNDAPTLTREGDLMGTPGYMSPEQAGCVDLPPDTRSDIHALGVLLYELLTDRLPEPEMRVRPAHASCELYWKAESARASSCLVDAIAPRTPRVRDELDWIILRCLAVDPARRYQSASALRDDLQRFLRGEPVQARPPTMWYRARKTVRRHKVASAIGATALLASVVLLAVLSAGLVIVESERREAEAARQHAEDVGAFVLTMLDPRNLANRGAQTTLVDVFDGSYERIEEEYADQPALAIELHRIAAGTLQPIGQVDEALRHYLRQAELAQALFGEDSRQVLTALSGASTVLGELGRWEEAREIDERTLALAERILEPDDPARLIARERVAEHWAREGRVDEALAEQAVVTERFRVIGPATIDRYKSEIALGSMYFAHREQTAASNPMQRARETLSVGVDGLRRLNPNHDYLLQGLNALGAVQWGLGEHEQAVATFRKIIPLVDAQFGTEATPAFTVRSNLAAALEATGGYDEALEVREELESLGSTPDAASGAKRLISAARHARLLFILEREREAIGRAERVRALAGDHVPETARELIRDILAPIPSSGAAERPEGMSDGA